MTGEGEGPTEAGQGPASVGNGAGHCRGGSAEICCGERPSGAELRVAQARGGGDRCCASSKTRTGQRAGLRMVQHKPEMSDSVCGASEAVEAELVKSRVVLLCKVRARRRRVCQK